MKREVSKCQLTSIGSYPGNDVFVKIWAILTSFQKCIEALIDKQYLERREGTKDEYTYMAWRDSNKMAKMFWSLKCIWRSLPDNSPLSWTKTTKVCPGFYAKAFLHLKSWKNNTLIDKFLCGLVGPSQLGGTGDKAFFELVWSKNSALKGLVVCSYSKRNIWHLTLFEILFLSTATGRSWSNF